MEFYKHMPDPVGQRYIRLRLRRITKGSDGSGPQVMMFIVLP